MEYEFKVAKGKYADAKAKLFYGLTEDWALKYNVWKKGRVDLITVELADMHVGIQKGGNAKTGPEWLLNTLPGEHPIEVDGKPITNVRGTCQGCCDGCERFCYAIRGAQQHHNSVMPSLLKNTTIYRKDPARFEAEIDSELTAWESKESKESKEGKKTEEKVFRWHASGEIEDYPYLEMMMRIAENHPTIIFYTYTKRFKLVERYLKAYGDFPANFTMIFSRWGTNIEDSGFDMSLIGKVTVFDWKEEMSVEDYNKTLHCRAVVHDKEGEKKGHLDHSMNCRKCGLCWRGLCRGRTITVYNH